MGARLLLAAVLVLLRTPGAEALAEPGLCYVLDAILFLYGIVLTSLYCRLKLLARRTAPSAASKEVTAQLGLGTPRSGEPPPQPAMSPGPGLDGGGSVPPRACPPSSTFSFSFLEEKEENIYTGLRVEGQELYETLQTKPS